LQQIVEANLQEDHQLLSIQVSLKDIVLLAKCLVTKLFCNSRNVNRNIMIIFLPFLVM